MKKVSSKDVAREANVSQATVSYVLNNRQDVKIKPETREKVLEAIKKLNYFPDLKAKSMKTRRAYSIGIVTTKDVTNTLFANVLKGIVDALEEEQISATLCRESYENIQDSDCIGLFKMSMIDGIIFVYKTLSAEDIAYLQENNVHFVVLQNTDDPMIGNVVFSSMEDAFDRCMLDFQSDGIREIGFIGNGAGDPSSYRYGSFARSIHKILRLTAATEFRTVKREEEMEEEIGRYIGMIDRLPQAFICQNIVIAWLAIRILQRTRGVNVPEDLRIVTIGNYSHVQYMNPALSTISAPLYDMGRECVNMLLSALNDRPFPEHVMLNWSYEKRES